MEAHVALDRDFDFVADATGFEWKNALGCANAALLAYADEEAVLSQALRVWKMKDARFFFSGESTQAFAMANDDMVLVAFRGTQIRQLDDLLIDAEIQLVAGLLSGRIHLGFHDALSEVWSDVERTIEEFGGGRGGKPLFLTGHSLGASLAALAASKRLSENKPVQGLYTFGQPRTGDEDWSAVFSEDFKTRFFRFVNNNDIVPRVPPRILGYKHGGTFCYFDEDGNYETHLSFWHSLRDRAEGEIYGFCSESPDDIDDHFMDAYLDNVRRAAKHGPRRYSQFKNARKVRRATLRLVADVTQVQSEQRPAAGKWSVGEVLDHLLKLDDLVVRELEVALKPRPMGLPFVYRGITDLDAGVPSLLRPMLPLMELPFDFMNVCLPQAIRLRLFRNRNVPLFSPGPIRPRYGQKIETLRKRLGETYDKLAEKQAKRPSLDLDHLYYYNPIAGLASVAGMYDFISGHEERHQDQLRDLRRQLALPPAEAVRAPPR